MDKAKYFELLLQIKLAENCHRDMMISAAKYQADADRADRKAISAFEHKAVKLQRQLENLEGEAM